MLFCSVGILKLIQLVNWFCTYNMKYVSLQVPLGLFYKNLHKFATIDKIYLLKGVFQDNNCLRLKYCSVERHLETTRTDNWLISVYQITVWHRLKKIWMWKEKNIQLIGACLHIFIIIVTVVFSLIGDFQHSYIFSLSNWIKYYNNLQFAFIIE